MFTNMLSLRGWFFPAVVAIAMQFANSFAALAGPSSQNMPEQGYIGAARDIRLYTENLPPFNFRSENGIIGVGADVVAALAKLVGHSRPPEMLPWKRVLSILEKEPYAAAFSMVRIPQRENEFKWVGPITHAQTAFYQLAGSPLKITSLDDARMVSAIGVQAGGASERALRALGFTNLMSLYNPTNGLQMLLSGRISLWETADLMAISQSRALGIDPDMIEPALTVGEYDLYLAFSLTTPDTVILPWKQALDELHRNGVFDEIQARYGVRIGTNVARKTSFSLLN
ncbi:substrate-binding periplasmic protein [Thalassospira mesophila]|uniref:Solute-binding protein family 3/N-terminal domain-containing protein n=1 Tax=Thalassospira mesophila TaxID=1293891 RepID=A0A1Y2L1M1_9PROT|nr:ABC transporter substrate-binding protein [Thalassospira mesophila]OSQ38854.1 hypothetical protein TMES_08810 [Thalassospira mesophila]